MLYAFYGSEISESGRKARALVDSLRAKKPDAAFDIISADNWNPAVLEGHLGGQGLFSSKYIIFVDRLTDNAEAKDEIGDFIPAMAESVNIFIVLEGKLTAELKKAIEKNAEKTVISDGAAVSKWAGAREGGAGGWSSGRRSGTAKSASSVKNDFNIFALADAVGLRDAMKSWAVYREAVDRGLESESIVGTLFWQVKSMAVAATVESATASGLSPFVYSKSKKYATHYTTAEMSDLLGQLIRLYHDGHRGLADIELGVERLLLGLKK